MIDRYSTRVKLISICVRLSHCNHNIMILPHQSPNQTYITMQSFIHFPDSHYVIILATRRIIITNPFTTAFSTTISFSNSFKPFDTAENVVSGDGLRVSFSSHPISPIRTLLYIACILVCGCKTVKVQRRLDVVNKAGYRE